MRESTRRRTRTISAGVSPLLDHKGRKEKKKKERKKEKKREGRGNEMENEKRRGDRENGTKEVGGVESRSPPRLQWIRPRALFRANFGPRCRFVLPYSSLYRRIGSGSERYLSTSPACACETRVKRRDREGPPPSSSWTPADETGRDLRPR